MSVVFGNFRAKMLNYRKTANFYFLKEREPYLGQYLYKFQKGLRKHGYIFLCIVDREGSTGSGFVS